MAAGRKALFSGLRQKISTNQEILAWPFVVAGLGLLLVGLAGVLLVLLMGHHEAYAVSREVPWGLLIGTYTYFAVISTGLAFIGGLGVAFGQEKYARMHKRIVVLAFITLLAGFTQIGMEVGHPFRLLYVFLISPQTSAPIFWMGFFYSLKLAILAVELYLIFRPGPAASPRLVASVGFLALLVGIVAASTLGFVFGSLNARPFFHGAFYPLFLIISGISGAAALLIVIQQIVYKFSVPQALQGSVRDLGRLMGVGIAGMMILFFWHIASSLYTEPQGAYTAAMSLLSGDLAVSFWMGEVILAMLLPLALILLVKAARPGILAVAGIAHLFGLFWIRFDFVVAGQLPLLRQDLPGAGVAGVNGLAQYAPSGVEWMIFALGLGLFLTLYFAAEKFLNLEPQH